MAIFEWVGQEREVPYVLGSYEFCRDPSTAKSDKLKQRSFQKGLLFFSLTKLNSDF